MALDIQFQSNIVDMRSNYAFLELKGIGDFDRKMVETEGCHISNILFACEVSFDISCHKCNDWKKVKDSSFLFIKLYII